MVNITDSQYRPMQYILAKGDIIEVNPYAIQLFHRVKCILVQKSDTSRGVYLRVAFMPVFAQHPAAIIQGRLL